MVEGKLSKFERARLLAIKDHFNSDNYDEEFYKLLHTTVIPGLLELDERIRRAIVKFTTEVWGQQLKMSRALNIDDTSIVLGAITEALLQGYEVGRKRRRPLTTKREGR